MEHDQPARQTWELFYQGQNGYAPPYHFLCDARILGKFFETFEGRVAVSSLISALQEYFNGEITVEMTRCCMLHLLKDMLAEFTDPCQMTNCSHDERAEGCSVRDLFSKLVSGQFGAPMPVHECQHTRQMSGVDCLREVILRNSNKFIVATAHLVDYTEIYKVFPLVEWTNGKLQLGIPNDIWNEIVKDGTVAPANQAAGGTLERGIW